MTCMYEKRGPKYHWIPDLYKCLNLPVIQEASNIKRRQQLGRAKQEKVKKRRMQLLKFQMKEAAEHGGDMYGKTDDTDSKAPEKKKGSVTQINTLCRCGCRCTPAQRVYL